MQVSTQVVYATGLIGPENLGERVPRATQSIRAEDLLRHVVKRSGPWFTSSKSHSRAAVAVAACAIPRVTIGIDIEWMAPERPIQAMARSLVGREIPCIGMHDFYRLWTFRESYFKAFQCAPAAAMVLEFLSCDSSSAIHWLAGGVNILEHRLAADAFQLCLVWSGPARTPLYLGEITQS